MVSFGKNKDDKATEKPRHRYEQPDVVDEEIADVLLTEQDAPPLVAALVEPDSSKDDDVIYELVVEEDKDNAENEDSNEPSEAARLNEQVSKLCREYEAINQQLEKSLVASDDLTRQLEKSKKVVTASYVALGVAGLACLLGVGAIVTGISMQRDVDDLRSSLATLTKQTTVAKQESAVKNQALNEQIVQLNEKVDKVFADSNLDNVLQVTQELKKQINALANKNLAAMASRSHSESHSPKESKISLPSLKLNSAGESANNKKTSVSQTVEKTAVTPNANTEKKAQNGKLPGLDDAETVPVKQKKHRWHRISKKQKDQNHAAPVEKPAKLPPPALPKLE